MFLQKIGRKMMAQLFYKLLEQPKKAFIFCLIIANLCLWAIGFIKGFEVLQDEYPEKPPYALTGIKGFQILFSLLKRIETVYVRYFVKNNRACNWAVLMLFI